MKKTKGKKLLPPQGSGIKRHINTTHLEDTKEYQNQVNYCNKLFNPIQRIHCFSARLLW